jgi:hypothetical protein
VQQSLTYAYLVSWIVGGLVLVTLLLLRTQWQPLWLSVGLMAFGAAGFLALGLGLGGWHVTLASAVLAGLVGVACGLGLSRLGRADRPLS